MLLVEYVFEICVNSRYSKTTCFCGSVPRSFEICVNSRYSKTLCHLFLTLLSFEICVNSRYSKTRVRVASAYTAV